MREGTVEVLCFDLAFFGDRDPSTMLIIEVLEDPRKSLLVNQNYRVLCKTVTERLLYTFSGKKVHGEAEAVQ